ncbi:MAG: hypothetical protein ACXWZM_09145 [Solirubrobacterales bacterium]
MAASLGSCGGGGESQFSNQSAGRFPVEVTAASFPARQQLDQNAYLRIGVRNRGQKTMPAMAVTITIGGKKGVESTQPFSIRDPQPGLASPDRPVWILADTYPRIAGVPGPGGAQTSNNKTFDFGSLKPGQARVGVWKLGAVKPGAYKLRYRIDAGLSGSQEAVNAGGGGPPIGSFAARIALKPQLTRINSKGEIVPVGPAAQGGGASGGTGGGGTGGTANPNATSGTANGSSGSYPPSGSLPPSGSGSGN